MFARLAKDTAIPLSEEGFFGVETFAQVQEAQARHCSEAEIEAIKLELDRVVSSLEETFRCDKLEFALCLIPVFYGSVQCVSTCIRPGWE